MRIALVHSFYSRSLPSGENRVVEDQMASLERAGHKVKLFSLSTDSLSENSFYEINAAWRAATGLGSDPLKAIESFRPDVVQVHNLFPNFGTKWLQSISSPTLLTIHNYRSVCANGMLFRDGKTCMRCVTHSRWNAVVNACYHDSRAATFPVTLGLIKRGSELMNTVDAVITTSKHSDELIRQFTGIKQTFVVPNFGHGVATQPLSRSQRNGWLVMGRLTAEKGVLRLVEQWPDREHLLIVGNGDEANSIDIAIKGKNIKRINSLAISDLRNLIPKFSGLIMPSLWPEIAPQVVVEAMRVGLPVIANKANFVSALVQESGTGAVYHDQDTLIAALATVESDLESFSLNAAKHFEKEWSESIWLERIQSAYSQVTSR